MNDTMVRETAKKWLELAEQKTRQSSSEEFVTFDLEKDADLKKMVETIHDGMLPNDWTYQTIHNFLSRVAETQGRFDNISPMTDELDSDLKRWLCDYPNATTYIDDAMSEGVMDGTKTTMELISMGQYQAIQDIQARILHFMRNSIMTPEEKEGEEIAKSDEE